MGLGLGLGLGLEADEVDLRPLHESRELETDDLAGRLYLDVVRVRVGWG